MAKLSDGDSRSLCVGTVDPRSPALEEVKLLWRANSRTLGFFPDGAFADYANRGQILYAGEIGSLKGYLSYRISDDRCVIVHLCTAETARGTGVARALTAELKTISKRRGFRGIGLSCRADFPANSLWPNLGFCPIHERAGKSRDGKLLTYWWFDHGLPDLFSLAADAIQSARVNAAIDANIFFDLVSDREQGDESRALLADWLQSEVDLCITDEIYHEISRGDDEEVKRRCRERLSLFRLLSSTEERQTAVRDGILQLLGTGSSVQERSDRAHLVKAAAAKVQIFLTRDNALLRASDGILQYAGIEVMRPVDLIGRIDELRRTAAYEPARLAGSRIALRRIKADEVSDISTKFCASARAETLTEFRREVRALLAYPDQADSYSIVDDDEIIAVVGYARAQMGVISVRILRVAPGPLAHTLNRHLVLRAIQAATLEGYTWVRIEDRYPSADLQTALAELSFFRIGGQYVRCVLRAMGTIEEGLLRLQSLPQLGLNEADAIATEVNRLRSEPARLAEEMERVFWPIKVLGAGIPTFVVAIHPKWAQHFFDEHLAGQELFGADPLLALNREHVYYRAPNRCGLRAPARILWYVTKDGDFEGTMAIRACSRLIAIDVGRPKQLFRRYQRLGVYLWQNVYDTAKNSIDNDLMALRFADTEVFSDPVSLAAAKQLGIKANFESPVRIDEGIFREIYRLGMARALSTSMQ